eukprot:1069782-Amorphochlora_amoeboformis.AAC.2
MSGNIQNEVRSNSCQSRRHPSRLRGSWLPNMGSRAQKAMERLGPDLFVDRKAFADQQRGCRTAYRGI